MTRGFGVIDVTNGFSDWFIAIAGLITQLGDMWFLVLGIGGVYVIGTRSSSVTATPRRDCLYLFALAIGAYALTVSLKHVFSLPRPPGATMEMLPVWLPASSAPVYESLVTDNGFGFPSGHAVGSTVVYGGAALVFEKLDERRYVVSGAIVLIVALSRIVLGVHYVVDVLVGILVGVVFLIGMNRMTKEDPRQAFTISALLGGVAVVLSMTYTSMLTLVAAGFGLGSWTVVERHSKHELRN